MRLTLYYDYNRNTPGCISAVAAAVAAVVSIISDAAAKRYMYTRDVILNRYETPPACLFICTHPLLPCRDNSGLQLP